MLDITVTAGDSGPVMRLSGESDLTVAGQLGDALNTQISGGAGHLVVDLSELRFADSATVRVLVQAHRALQENGGGLEIAFPQPAVAAALRLLGVDQMLTVRAQPGSDTPAPGTDASLHVISGGVQW
jgi:anti-sigma B factor antagonist